MTLPQRWDIFCTVVDNYGDAGVSWRLARQLAAEHGLDVRLYIDALPTLARLAPGIDARVDAQRVCDVDVRRWHGANGDWNAPVDVPTVADVVVEAFGCGLPASYLDQMSTRASRPAWINLEYMSAELWVESSHRLLSRHPTLPLARTFYFPGFTPATGGLLREAGLFARRDAFVDDAKAIALLHRSLGLPGLPGLPDLPAGATLISLFCYANAQLSGLLDAWAQGDADVVCLVPDGVAVPDLGPWLGSKTRGSHSLRRGRLTVARVPFVAQDEYDRILWSCAINFVRGEDSFVRSLWAGRPFVWHLYPQAGQAQTPKLDAMLARFDRGLPIAAQTAIDGFSRSWNDPHSPSDACARLWPKLAEALPSLAQRTRVWADELATQPDLASALVKTASQRV